MIAPVIRSFRDNQAERLFRREAVKRLDRKLQPAALRKLVMLNAAESLDDLRALPGNRLEALGQPHGPAQHSDQRAVASLLPVGRWRRLGR